MAQTPMTPLKSQNEAQTHSGLSFVNATAIAARNRFITVAIVMVKRHPTLAEGKKWYMEKTITHS